MRIRDLRAIVVNVSPKTNWVFVEVETDQGRIGTGETSLNGWEPLLVAYAESLAAEVRGSDFKTAFRLSRIVPDSPGGLVAHAVCSALEQALWDLRAQQSDEPIHAAIGGAVRADVPVYANVNRGVTDRSPQGFAVAARKACDDGYQAVKLAPFDGVAWDDASQPEHTARIADGIDRIAAVRDAVGPSAALMVDCHCRFNEPGAALLIKQLEPFRLHWIECPISESAANHAAIGRLRRFANDHGTRLAGGERQSGLAGFKPFIDDKLYDVLMPDLKYAGGFVEIQRIAAAAALAGIEIAPHNPSGPICHAGSVHLSATLTNFITLELQYLEDPLFLLVAKGDLPQVVEGRVALSPSPGLGLSIDHTVCASRQYRRCTAGFADARLG